MQEILAMPALTRLLAAGVHDLDDEDARLRKSLAILAGVLFMLAGTVWAGLCRLIDPDFPLAVALLGLLPLLPNYLIFARRSHSQAFHHIQNSLFLGFPLLIASAGWGAGSLALWALPAPFTTLLARERRHAMGWFASCVALIAALNSRGAPPLDPAATGLTLLCVSTVLFLLQNFAMGHLATVQARLAETHQSLKREQDRSERLLLNILPAPVAARLKDAGETIADGFPEAVVMFADMVDYTRIASSMPPQKIFELLNRVFSRFDELAEQRGLERIKTIGDAYMVAGGLHARPGNPHLAMASLALDMQQVLRDPAITDGRKIELRIGIASGPVVAGVVGRGRFIYDLWGDTVNIAYRLCTEGRPGGIQCDTASFQRLNGRFAFARPELLPLKGKGHFPVYRLQTTRFLSHFPEWKEVAA